MLLAIIEHRPWDPSFEPLIEVVESFNEAYEKMLVKSGSYKEVYDFHPSFHPKDYLLESRPYNWTTLVEMSETRDEIN
jgi:hypothetical protein